MRMKRKKIQMKRKRRVKAMRTVRNKKRRKVLRKKMITSLRNLIKRVIPSHQRLQKYQSQQRRMTMMRRKKRIRNQQRKPKLNQNLCLDWTQKMKVMNQMLCQKLRLKSQFDLTMVRIHQDSLKNTNQSQLTLFSFKLKLLNLNLKLLKQSHLKTFMKN